MRMALVIAGLACAAAYAQTDLERVQDKVQNFRDQIQAATAAQQAGNIDMAQKHQVNAERFIAEARTMLEDQGAARSQGIETLLLYSEVLGLQREYDLAAEVLRNAVRLAPTNPALWRHLGRALAEVGPGYATNALEALRRGLALQPPPALAADMHQIQGQVYLDMGLYDLARDAYTNALQAEPANPSAVVGLAALDLREGNVAEAEARLQSIPEMSPELSGQLQRMLLDAFQGMDANRAWFADTPANHKAYGRLLMQAGRFPRAIDPLERARTLDPSDHVTWNLLASAYRGLGDIARVKDALEQSLALEPNQPRTRELLEAIRQAELAAPPPAIAAPPQ